MQAQSRLLDIQSLLISVKAPDIVNSYVEWANKIFVLHAKLLDCYDALYAQCGKISPPKVMIHIERMKVLQAHHDVIESVMRSLDKADWALLVLPASKDRGGEYLVQAQSIRNTCTTSHVTVSSSIFRQKKKKYEFPPMHLPAVQC